MSVALEKAVEKIYEKIAENGEITNNQLALIYLYEKRNKPNQINDILKNGEKIINSIDKVMGGTK